jgi:hypothetical protein
MASPNHDESIAVSSRQLWLIRAALQEYLATFSHTEGELVDEIKLLLQQLPTVGDPNAPVNQVFPSGRRLIL